jgi:L-seryl-tRNA(Ser) seleniumtransferase
MQTLRVLLLVAVAAIVAGCSTTPSQTGGGSVEPPPKPAGPVVGGTWIVTTQSPMGSRDADAIFTQVGEQLSGKMVSPRGEVPLAGTLKGDAVAFGVNVNVQGQELQIDYTGTVDGDTMSGTVQFGPIAKGTWTGKRKMQ